MPTLAGASGIYAITNSKSGKVYIGSTVGLENRWRQHKRNLHRGEHGNPHLQAAWNKYGESAFGFVICEYVENKEQLYVREQYWLDFHRMLTEAYNYGPIARHPMLGRSPSEETRRKTSNTLMGNQNNSGHQNHLGHKHTSVARRKMREARGRPYPAFIHQDTGEVIPAGVNLRALCRERGLVHQNLCDVKLGKCRHCRGWRLVEGAK